MSVGVKHTYSFICVSVSVKNCEQGVCRWVYLCSCLPSAVGSDNGVILLTWFVHILYYVTFNLNKTNKTHNMLDVPPAHVNGAVGRFLYTEFLYNCNNKQI